MFHVTIFINLLGFGGEVVCDQLNLTRVDKCTAELFDKLLSGFPPLAFVSFLNLLGVL